MSSRYVLSVVLVAAMVSCSSDDGAAPTTVDASTTASTASTATTTASDCESRGVVSTTGLAYPPLDGPADPALLLDVHVPEVDEGCPSAPAMIWVHGGGWRRGSRSNGLTDKIDLFVREQGWALVSVDYRLSPDPIDVDAPDAVRFPTHIEDVAAAVGLVQREGDRLGIDPDQLGLLGHSAGAQIVALLATDERYLDRANVERSDVGCVGALDTSAYDLTAVAADNPVYLNAFTRDPDVWGEASALLQVDPGEMLPDMLVINQDRPRSRTGGRAFVEAVESAGGDARLVVATGLDHQGINQAVGRNGDDVVTPEIVELLTRCTAPT